MGGDAVVAVSDNYAGKDSQTFSKTYTLPDGTFNFKVIDSYEDGICCHGGDGDYSVYRNGAEMIAMDPGSNYGMGTTSETIYVQDGIFALEVTDDYGDGMETGSYSAYRNGVEMVSMEAGFNFGKNAVEVFGSDDFCA